MDQPLDVAGTPAPADSSPAHKPLEVPRDPEGYAEWRKTGALPERATKTPKREASAASKESSAAAEPGAEKDAPASEAGNEKQEQRKRATAETRLTELLADLKRAGLTPAELKTFKRELQEQQTAGEAAPKSETTANPAAPQAPKKPKVDDFDSYEKFEDAKDKYYEELADYRADLKLQERDQRQQAEANRKEVNERLAEARERYGEGLDATIQTTAKAVFEDAKIPSAVKAIINDSPVMVDLLYTLGSKELSEFVALSKSNPGDALRQVVLMEHLVKQELAGKDTGTGEKADRDESGKFTAKTPAKKITEAPPPPKEASGRSGPPPDEVESAAKANDFRRFQSAANSRDLAKQRGR